MVLEIKDLNQRKKEIVKKELLLIYVKPNILQ